jgi:hypothetical protein
VRSEWVIFQGVRWLAAVEGADEYAAVPHGAAELQAWRACYDR